MEAIQEKKGFMKKYDLNDIFELLDILRGENGCAWDRQQTFESLKNYLLEEAYEVAEAIEDEDYEAFKEELGDLLFHIMFHIHMAEEKEIFTFDAIKEGLLNKMRLRHPHIFGDIETEDPKVILKNWESIKKQTRRKAKSSTLDGVPRDFPVLLKARRLQEKAANVGFDWPKAEQVLNKIEEEIRELRASLSAEKMEEELGDLLFAVVNLSRFYKVDPEKALKGTISKFDRRFRYIEEKTNHKMTEYSLEKLEEIWQEAKREE